MIATEHDPKADLTGGRLVCWNGNAIRDPADGWRWPWGEPIDGAIDVLNDYGRVVDCLAPELAPSRLLGAPEVCLLTGLAEGTIASYLSRGTFLRPVRRVGICNVWTLGQLAFYLAHRRGFRAERWYG